MSKLQGIKIHFNEKNIYGTEPCCCQKGYKTKFGASTLFCFFCNMFKLRKRRKTNSFCKKNGWAKDCSTCQQRGTYHVFGE